MWTNQQQNKAPGTTQAQGSGSPVTPFSDTAAIRASGPISSNLSCLGATLEVKGTIYGDEDLQIDGKVEGPISLLGQKLTVGRTGQLKSEVTAREVVIHGKVAGNLCASDRVEIKKDSEAIGDIRTARIGIEDGAHFKGRIEIDRTKPVAVPGSAAYSAVEK